MCSSTTLFHYPPDPHSHPIPSACHILAKTPRQWFKLNGVCQTCQLIKWGFALSMHFSVTALFHRRSQLSTPSYSQTKHQRQGSNSITFNWTERRRGRGVRGTGCQRYEGRGEEPGRRVWRCRWEFLLIWSAFVICFVLSSHKNFVNGTHKSLPQESIGMFSCADCEVWLKIEEVILHANSITATRVAALNILGLMS